MEFELVIFDMDGTLVDSESMAEGVISELTQELSRPLSAEECSQRFRAHTIDYIFHELAALQGEPLPADFGERLEMAYHAAVSNSLLPTEGVKAAIDELKPMAMCVASNGEPESIALSLKSAGLTDYFGRHAYSARQVARPKPFPDLFLFAAENFGVTPAACVVVEDSVVGVQAALDAGMAVVGFCGNDMDREHHLREMNIPVITDMAELPALVKAGR